jgi:hypothetical protein
MCISIGAATVRPTGKRQGGDTVKKHFLSIWIAVLSPVLIANLPMLSQESLDAKDWQTRATALSKIESSGVRKDSVLRAKLAELLEKENLTVKSVFEHTGGKSGVSTTLGEDYSEYYSRLYAAVFTFAKDGDDSALPVLARGAFSTDSEAAGFFLVKWQATLPVFLEESKGNSAEKTQSLDMLSRIAVADRSSIPRQQLQSIKSAMLQNLSDQDPNVRLVAVRSISSADFKEFLPDLQRLAERDPSRLKSHGKLRYPIREEAIKATQSLKIQ